MKKILLLIFIMVLMVPIVSANWDTVLNDTNSKNNLVNKTASGSGNIVGMSDGLYGDALSIQYTGPSSGANVNNKSTDWKFLPGENKTIEFWFKWNGSIYTGGLANQKLLVFNTTTVTGNKLIIRFTNQIASDPNRYNLSLRLESSFSGFATSDNKITDKILNDSQWHHVAITWYNSSVSGANLKYLRTFFDGISINAITSTIGNESNIAHISFGSGGQDAWLGAMLYIDEARISNITRYLANFTPPTSAFTLDSSTISLWHFDNMSTVIPTPPRFYSQSNNLTVPPNFNEPYRFSVKWNDTFGTVSGGSGSLSKVYLEINSSGVSKNYSLNFPLLVSSHFFNVTNYSINGPVYFYWKFYANDSEGTWNQTDRTFSNISGAVCVDILHPDWGINSRCGHKRISFNFNVSFFRDKLFNGSVSSINLTYSDFTISGYENKTIGIIMHQEDIIKNVTLNLTGFVSLGNYPSDVKIYINKTLSNDVGLVTKLEVNNLTTFRSSATMKNATFIAEGINTTGYLRLPKEAVITTAYINLTGFKHRIGGNATGQAFTTVPAIGPYTGLTANSTHYYLVSYFSPNIVYRFNTTPAGEFESTFEFSFSIASQTSTPQAITQARDALWVLGQSEKRIFKYNFAGVYTGTSISISQVTFPLSLAWNYTHFFVGDESAHSVLVYTNAGSYSGINFSTAAEITELDGMVYRNNSLWIVDFFTALKEYNISGNYTGNAIETNGAMEAAFNGSHFFMAIGSVIVYTNLNQSFPTAPYMEVGAIDGTREYSFPTSFFQNNNRTDNFATPIQAYLNACASDASGLCDVPIFIGSSSLGTIELSDLLVDYTYQINPIKLDLNAISNYITNSSGHVILPIVISAVAASGTLQVNGLNYDHAGGNDTIAIIAHNLNYTAIEKLNITMHFSNYKLDFPKHIQYLEFIPSTPTSKNVTPFGQAPLKPIFNITSIGYSSSNSNFSVYLNESFSCVDLSWSTNSTNIQTQIASGINYFYDDFETDFGHWAVHQGINCPDAVAWGGRDTSTSSANTGPQDGGVGGAGTYFIFVETSSGSCYDSGDIALVYFNTTINYDAFSNEKIEFYFDAYGADIDSLYFEENSTGSWVKLWEMHDINNDYWNFTSVDLSGLTGNGSLRFNYTRTSTGFTSDIALDRINVSTYNTSISVPQNILSDSWIDVFTNVSYAESNGLWMWADYSCNFTNWRLWEPAFYFRGCATNATICSEALT